LKAQPFGLGPVALAACVLLGACARPHRPPAPPARPASVPTLPDSSLREESLRERPPADTTSGKAAPDGPYSSGEPMPILAAIGPQTPPASAASLRLTDRGRQCLAEDDTRGALDVLEKAVKLDPNNGRAYYWLAQVHFREGRYDQAAAFADKASLLLANSDPASASQAYAFKAMVFEQVGRYGDARKAYQQAIAFNSSNVAAQAGLSRLATGSETIP